MGMSSSGGMSGTDQQHSNTNRTGMAGMNMMNNGGGMGGSSSSVSGMNSMSGGIKDSIMEWIIVVKVSRGGALMGVEL